MYSLLARTVSGNVVVVCPAVLEAFIRTNDPSRQVLKLTRIFRASVRDPALLADNNGIWLATG